MRYVRMVINIPMYIIDVILEMDIRIQVEYGGRSFSHVSMQNKNNDSAEAVGLCVECYLYCYRIT